MSKQIKKEEVEEPNLRLIGETDPSVLWRKTKALNLRRKSPGETSKDYFIGHSSRNQEGDHYETLHWRGAPNTNCYRYWNENGSYFEKLPDHSEYFIRANGHEGFKTKEGAGWERRGFYGHKVYFNVHLLPEDLKAKMEEEDD